MKLKHLLGAATAICLFAVYPAQWRHRHVAPVIAGPHPDGTVTVADSWATHRVRMAGLMFVQPPSLHRAPSVTYASGAPL